MDTRLPTKNDGGLERVRAYIESPGFARLVTAVWSLVLVSAALALHHRVAGTRPGREDTYYAWLDGERLAHGSNPYERVLAGDMHTNNSYATYFPVYYLLSATLYRLGVTDYMDWLALWRPLCELSHVAIAIGLLVFGVRPKAWPLGLWASGFFFFNRWTIGVVNMAHLDVPAVALLLLAIHLRRRTRASALLFGASLAVKQMAIFLLPLWILAAYLEEGSGDPKARLGRALRVTGWTAAIPLTLSAPFLVWSPAGFVKSVLFSATRDPVSDFPSKSFDAALGLSGLVAKAPMLGLMALVYVAFALAPKRVGLATAALLVMSTFIDFNSVLFQQYMVWTVPLLPFAWFEARAALQGAPASAAAPAEEQPGEVVAGGAEAVAG
jgi:uncharacterized membrane protein